MTKDGQENRFGRFLFEDEQAERVKAGDMSAVWEFIEDNRKFLTAWARKYIRNRFYYMPQGYYEADDLLNQIYVDFPLYRLENEKAIFSSIARSFARISCGGYSGRTLVRKNKEISLDAPSEISERSGERNEGSTLSDILPSREPTPFAALERKEHVQEIAPRYFREIGRLFKADETGSDGGATFGEMLAEKYGSTAGTENSFQTVIEEVFFGYSFEEIKAYAERVA